MACHSDVVSCVTLPAVCVCAMIFRHVGWFRHIPVLVAALVGADAIPADPDLYGLCIIQRLGLLTYVLIRDAVVLVAVNSHMVVVRNLELLFVAEHVS